MVDINQNPVVVSDKKLEISEGLLEDIRHEFVTLHGLVAFDSLGDGVANNGRSSAVVPISQLIDLNYKKLLDKIDEVLEQ